MVRRVVGLMHGMVKTASTAPSIDLNQNELFRVDEERKPAQTMLESMQLPPTGLRPPKTGLVRTRGVLWDSDATLIPEHHERSAIKQLDDLSNLELNSRTPEALSRSRFVQRIKYSGCFRHCTLKDNVRDALHSLLRATFCTTNDSTHVQTNYARRIQL